MNSNRSRYHFLYESEIHLKLDRKALGWALSADSESNTRHLIMSKFAPHRRGTNNPSATANTVCQKCLGKGHFIYECKGAQPYVSRPSRTEQLEKPSVLSKLKKSGGPSIELPDEFRTKSGTANKILEERERQRRRTVDSESDSPPKKRRKRSSSPSDISTSTASSDSESSSGTLTSEDSDSESNSGSSARSGHNHGFSKAESPSRERVRA